MSVVLWCCNFHCVVHVYSKTTPQIALFILSSEMIILICNELVKKGNGRFWNNKSSPALRPVTKKLLQYLLKGNVLDQKKKLFRTLKMRLKFR